MPDAYKYGPWLQIHEDRAFTEVSVILTEVRPWVLAGPHHRVHSNIHILWTRDAVLECSYFWEELLKV